MNAQTTIRAAGQKKRGMGLGATLAAGAAALVYAVVAHAQQPVLTITQSGANQYLIKITNGVSTANYELYRTIGLDDPPYPWTLHTIGTLGQTNFTINAGIEYLGFFQAAVGLDWDGDGIDNWQDAQPSSTNAGLLSITITSPANGSTIN